MKVNVLHLITKLELGGAQTSTLKIIRKLNRKKFNVFLGTGKGGILTDEARNIPETKMVIFKELKHEINPFYDLLAIFAVKSILNKEKIDIIHTHSSKAGIIGRFAAKLAGTPHIVHTIHGFSFNNYQHFLKRRLFVFLERWAALYTSRFIAVSTADIMKGLKVNIGNKDSYSLIRYGIDIKVFNEQRSNNLKKELEIPESGIVVGMIACLKPQKSPIDFIKLASLVVKKYPNTYFLLIGDGILRKEVEKTIVEFGLNKNCILAGWRNDIPELLSIFDIFVLTSLWEGLPITILEAMASGKPVIATKVDGAIDVIKDRYNGFLVPHGKPEMAAERVIELISNRDLRSKMGSHAKESLTKEFEEDSMVKKIEELYEELASGKNTGAH